ncbi:MAG: hypothetical protein LBI38_06985 [Oscillospiraceae bacterium]|jgi:hypothetical protein|nr:hypothetical protein [Oscillospiraceae bacterium]
MKGKEIIDYTIRGEIPDLERLREDCRRQAAGAANKEAGASIGVPARADDFKPEKTKPGKTKNAYAAQLSALCAALALIAGGFGFYAALKGDGALYSEETTADAPPEETDRRPPPEFNAFRVINGVTVNGYEIENAAPSKEEIEYIRANPNEKQSGFYWEENGRGYWYDYGYNDYDLPAKTFITKYKGARNLMDNGYYDNEIIWWAELDGSIAVEDILDVPGTDRTLVVGSKIGHEYVTDGERTAQYSLAYIAMLDRNGDIMWENPSAKENPPTGFDSAYNKAITDETGITALGVEWGTARGGLGVVMVARYDFDGNIVNIDGMASDGWKQVNSASLVDGGWIIGFSDGSFAADKSGWHSFDGDDVLGYTFTDMLVYNGKLYLSGYCVPEPTAKQAERAGGRSELAAILELVFGDTDYMWDDKYSGEVEGLTEAFRENYTAFLLVCDVETMLPESFYSVNGSFGDGLSVDGDGNLLWETASITYVFFSPYTSSFSFGGVSRIFAYTLDENGEVVNREKTGYTRSLRK